jgi:dimethylhistidine N-methyltransferase
MADSDERAGHEAFLRDVRAGLSQAQKVIPARWLYDRRGSELFEAITRVPDYYPTRTEAAILPDVLAALPGLVPQACAVVEFGAGAATKTGPLLRALGASHYVPVDISGDFLMESAARLEAAMPGLAVHPVVADFTRAVVLPGVVRGLPLLGFFPGSTIGNLAPAAAVDLLRGWARLLGAGAHLLIGFDLAKDRGVLEAAYDDRQGVTAAFNLNLLDRLNRELDGDVPLGAFCHRAVWNAEASRIEMHLEAVRDVRFSVAGLAVSMRAGESIHTENSHKWCGQAVALLARASHWRPVARWEDGQGWFSLQLWRVAADGLEP